MNPSGLPGQARCFFTPSPTAAAGPTRSRAGPRTPPASPAGTPSSGSAASPGRNRGFGLTVVQRLALQLLQEPRQVFQPHALPPLGPGQLLQVVVVGRHPQHLVRHLRVRQEPGRAAVLAASVRLHRLAVRVLHRRRDDHRVLARRRRLEQHLRPLRVRVGHRRPVLGLVLRLSCPGPTTFDLEFGVRVVAAPPGCFSPTRIVCSPPTGSRRNSGRAYTCPSSSSWWASHSTHCRQNRCVDLEPVPLGGSSAGRAAPTGTCRTRRTPAPGPLLASPPICCPTSSGTRGLAGPPGCPDGDGAASALDAQAYTVAAGFGLRTG